MRRRLPMPHDPSPGWCGVSTTGYGTQPPPVPTSGPHVHDLVAEDLAGRKALGVSKYGQALQASNGRDHLRDLYEELLDAAVYIRAELERRGQ